MVATRRLWTWTRVDPRNGSVLAAGIGGLDLATQRTRGCLVLASYGHLGVQETNRGDHADADGGTLVSVTRQAGSAMPCGSDAKGGLYLPFGTGGSLLSRFAVMSFIRR